MSLAFLYLRFILHCKKELMSKTVLVTGGAGYIGSHIALLMAQQGHTVIIFDDLLHNQPSNFSWATVINGNLADQQLLEHTFSYYPVDAVIHCAASIEVGQSVTDPLVFYANNVGNTVQLLQIMKTYDVRKIIFSSSCAVYGIPQITPIPEDHPKNPINPYGMSKLMVETILEDARKAYGIQYINLRYFNAAGVLPASGLGEYHQPETHLIPLLMQAAYEQKPFFLFGEDYPTPDGSCIRDFLHVWDIALAHAKAFTYLDDNNPSESFNLGSGCGSSVKEIIFHVQSISGQKIEVKIVPSRPGDPSQLIADPHKAFSILGWEAEHSSLHTIIKTAHDHFFYQYRRFLNKNSQKEA